MAVWHKWQAGLFFVCAATAIAQVHAAPYPANADHPPPAWFVDAAPQAGLKMQNVNGDESTKKYIIETTGSGVAILDYDRDGWPDIYLVNGNALDSSQNKNPPPTGHLYHNNHDGTFTDVTRAAGLTTSGWGQGACVGDYDNDGFDDLYVTYYGKNRLYHNEHNGTFKEVAAAAGVTGSGGEWGSGCAFVDYDRDGKLDLVVANYVHFDIKTAPRPGEGQMCIWKGVPVMCGPRGLDSTPNVLYHNLGGGRFADVSKTSGIEKTNGHYCLGVSTLDYNRDGWPDIYVACDSTPSILYRNNKDGTFTDVAVDAAVAFDEDGREQAGMGATVADYNGDGLPDIFKTNFSDDTSSLYQNNGDGTYSSRIFDAGLGLNTQYLGWGVMFFDMDNDGWPDILIANGHVYPEVDTAHLGATYKEPRLVYWNQGNGKFKDISRTCGTRLYRAAVQPRSGYCRFLESTGAYPQSSTTRVQSRCCWSTRQRTRTTGLGLAPWARNPIAMALGPASPWSQAARNWVQEVRSGSSYLSSSDLRLHFGLGAATKIDRVEIDWPSGLKESFSVPPVDRIVTLREGTGQALAKP